MASFVELYWKERESVAPQFKFLHLGDKVSKPLAVISRSNSLSSCLIE